MAKKLSEKQKKEIINKFSNGESLEKLSGEYNFAKSTISKHLKIDLGDKEYKEIINKFKSVNSSIFDREINVSNRLDNISNEGITNEDFLETSNPNAKFEEDQIFTPSQFTEIAPLDYDLQNTERKELSSIPILDMNFPDKVYMIVDKKIELEVKLLRHYPEWQFLPDEDLDRKTIEIYFDLKIAKQFCIKDQKVIKVPNTNVFKIAAPSLVSRGISRIVSGDNLIAL